MRRAAASELITPFRAVLRKSISLAVLAVTLLGCNASDGSGLKCKWPESYQQVSDASLPPASIVRPQVPGAHVLLDRSGSMVGYLDEKPPKDAATPEKGKWVGPNPYANLLKSLPHLLSRVTTRADVRYFGRSVSDPESVDQIHKASALNFYRCGAGCDNQESHIADALKNAYRAPPDDLSLVLTDLFLDVRDTGPEGAAAIRSPLEKILDDGRVVGILGIMVPFNGRISGLPAGAIAVPKNGFPFSGRHPVYIVLIGKDSVVRGFYEKVLRPEYLHELSKSGHEHQFLVFGNVTLRAAETQPALVVVAGRGRKRPIPASAYLRVAGMDNLPATERPELRRLQPDLELKLRLKDSPSWNSYLATLFPPSSVVGLGKEAGSISVKTRMWPLPSGDRCWGTELNPKPSPVTAAAARGNVLDVLSNTPIPSERGYLLQTAVEVKMDIHDENARWLDAWSFTALNADAQLKRRDGIFMTLNLAGITEPLEELVREKLAPGKPHQVAHAEAIVYLEN